MSSRRRGVASRMPTELCLQTERFKPARWVTGPARRKPLTNGGWRILQLYILMAHQRPGRQIVRVEAQRAPEVLHRTLVHASACVKARTGAWGARSLVRLGWGAC